MTVFCDNGDCCHIGEDGFCGCDKLSIVGGVCAGSCRSGRNACNGDVDERLKAENANLKKLVRDVYALNWNGFDCTECPWFDECRTEGGCPWLGILHDHMRELGVRLDG